MFAPDEGYSPDIREIPDPKAFMALIEWIYRRGVIEVLRGIKSVEPPDTMPAEHEQWEKFFAEMKAYATGLGKALEDGTVDLRMSFITMAWLLSKGAEMKEFLWDILKVRPVIEVQEAVKNDGTPGV